jgi:hypothetical protein
VLRRSIMSTKACIVAMLTSSLEEISDTGRK